VYDELRRRAGYWMSRERAGHTLQATALVNEAFLKIAGGGDVPWQSQRHFYNAAADAMRKILVDHARRKNAEKRGGASPARVPLDAVAVAAVGGDHDLDFERLDAALDKLRNMDERRHQVVMYRYFSGLDERRIADLLGVTVKTVQRDWKTARMFLLAEMTDPEGA
jgi:RNA polymerase sigma factor (TIGR02999 family)